MAGIDCKIETTSATQILGHSLLLKELKDSKLKLVVSGKTF